MGDLFAHLRRTVDGSLNMINYLRQSNPDNNAVNIGDNNEIDQYGRSNSCKHRRNSNNTGQKGDHNSTSVNGSNNGTLQEGNKNKTRTSGDKNKIGQKGNDYESSTRLSNMQIVQIARVSQDGGNEPEDKKYDDTKRPKNNRYFSRRVDRSVLEWLRWLRSHWPWDTEARRDS
ncbi:hypothetical protein F5Y02DRAFT_413699 [Annulohypoxylon stygium]|nr:hypothetical protein F5Y02DRAFT_413699 [Annulohypoxylon stygium]